MAFWNGLGGGSIRSKILMGFIAVMLFSDTAGVIAVWNLAQVREATNQVAGESLPRIQRAQEASISLHRMRIAQLRTMLADDNADRQAGETAVAQSITDTKQLLAAIQDASESAQRGVQVQTLVTHWDAYLKGNDKAMALTGEFGLKAMGGDYEKLFDTLKRDVSDIIGTESHGAEAKATAAEATYVRTRLLLIGVLLAANVFGLITATVVSARIAGPLAAAAVNAKAVARGDLTQHLASTGTDEVSVLSAALNDMQEGLRALVTRVRDGVASMHSASVEIASGGMDLSDRTEKQVCALEVTCTAIDQLTDTVQRNAETSRQANSAAEHAASAARKGGNVTNQIVEAMTRITSSSARISAIVAVIDGIAFQTNLLALNAAVEAARAGEQGRGFAVVASEVRGLAQRVAQSAREIKTLIEASSEVINHGASLVQDAGQTMENVVARSDEVTQLVASISSSTERQAKDLAKLSQSIASISDTTQQNAALVEESAAAVNSLKDQGASLDEAVAVFKLP